MTQQITLIAPSLNFLSTTTANLKQVLLLENLLPVGYAPLPSIIEIVRLRLWRQAPLSIPANSFGDISVAVDPDKRYLAESGFPGQEDCEPHFLNCLGAIEFAIGMPRNVVENHDPAIFYRPGRDAVIIAPELYHPSGIAYDYQIFLGFGIRSETAFSYIDGVVYVMPLNGSTSGNPTFCLRSQIPHISTGGTQVRVHVSALADGCNLTHSSIGVQSGNGPDMVSTPVPLTFNGQAGLNLSANQNMWSDWVSLTTTANQSLLINNTVSGAWAYKNFTPTPSWYSTNADSYSSAQMLGTLGYQPNRSHIVDCVQVQ